MTCECIQSRRVPSIQFIIQCSQSQNMVAVSTLCLPVSLTVEGRLQWEENSCESVFTYFLIPCHSMPLGSSLHCFQSFLSSFIWWSDWPAGFQWDAICNPSAPLQFKLRPPADWLNLSFCDVKILLSLIKFQVLANLRFRADWPVKFWKPAHSLLEGVIGAQQHCFAQLEMSFVLKDRFEWSDFFFFNALPFGACVGVRLGPGWVHQSLLHLAFNCSFYVSKACHTLSPNSWRLFNSSMLQKNFGRKDFFSSHSGRWALSPSQPLTKISSW